MSRPVVGVRVGREDRAVAYVELAQRLRASGDSRAWADMARVFVGLSHDELAAVASSLAFLAAGVQ